MRQTFSFWCKRCGGRVFEDEVLWEPVSYGEDKIVKKIELTCLLCSVSHRCEYKDYVHLLKEIERVLRERKNRKAVAS